jgi:hypothetical protein
MKSTTLALSILLAAPLTVSAADYHSDHLIPAGSLIQCTLSEPKLSSKTTAIGDPVSCRLSHTARYGRGSLPYDSFLVGRFEAYKDPGHFVGKGWMELTFDHMVIEPDTIVPVDARVVDVPGYAIDRQGRVLGKGHATRDTVLWMIPVLWPIDLIMLPMRGPRPVLKEETRLTLKVMDDLYVPEGGTEPERDPYGLSHRPSAQLDPPPVQQRAPQPMADALPQQNYAPPQPSYAAQPYYPQPQPMYAPQPVYIAPQPIVLAAAPVFVMPQPVYVAPPAMYIAPPAMYAAPQAMYMAPQQAYAAPSTYGYMGPQMAPQMASSSMWGPMRSTVPVRSLYGY